MRTSRALRTLIGSALVAALVGSSVSAAPRDSGGMRRPATVPDATKRAPEVPDGLSKAFENGRLDRAEYALERASTLFDLRGARERFGDVERPDPHDATLLLRDLVLHKDELSPSDRRSANRILARPSDGADDPQGDGWGNFDYETSCLKTLDAEPDPDVCFNAITDTSSPDHVTPSFLAQAKTEMAKVWNKEINRLGYKQPQRDGNSGSNERNSALDVYFADIGDDGLYGYCTTDEPGAANKKRVSAYCVLDNDYDPSQYDAPPPEVNGVAALRVTLAHEFFHAIQFNYDWREELFLMEGTAVWMEDVVYDSINAGYAFLFDSALHQPEIPLDAFQGGDDDENFEYGAFVFFTYLSEQKRNLAVRRIWNKAGARKQGIGAVSATINRLGHPGPSTPYRDFFARWGTANAVYDFFYSEGYDGDCSSGLTSYADVLRCNRPPFDGQYRLGPGYRSTDWQRLPMDRRSNRFVELFPPFSSTPATRMRVVVNLPNRARGGEASLLMFPSADFQRIKLNDRGNGVITVPFADTSNDSILILSNTGSHNNETYKFKAFVINEN